MRDSNGQLRELAEIDGLTGIANRRAFNARLATEWSLATELEQPIALLIVDVDHFKLFNDHYGHMQGDVCLRDLSESAHDQHPYSLGCGGPHMADSSIPPSFRIFIERRVGFRRPPRGRGICHLLQGADLEAASKSGGAPAPGGRGAAYAP